MKRGVLLVLILAILVGIGALAFARPGGGRGGAGRGIQGGAGGRVSNGPGQNGGRADIDNAGGNAIGPANRGVQGGQAGANSQTGQRRFSNDNLNGRSLQQAAQQHLGLNGDTRANAAGQGLEGQYNAANRPFTGDWYGNHPNAWQYPHADAWAVASLAGANAWLGWGAAVPVDYDDYYENTESDTLLQDAGNLAVTGMDDVASDGDWLSLGTYALAPQNQSQATLMLTLAVNKDGILRGTYLDLLSNSSQTIYGAIDKQSRRAAWVISPQGRVTMQTTLNDLTANNTPVSVQFENGRSELWSMVRQTTQ
jgi:hypothetical protein